MSISPTLPVYRPLKLSITHASGSTVYGSDGKKYIDFISGIGACSLGHSHSTLIKVLKEQSEKIWHTSNLFEIQPALDLANAYVKNTFADTTFFCSSGTEAVECGIKMVRAYQRETGNRNRYRIITFAGAFHGRTYGSSSAAFKLTENTFPALDGFDRVNHNIDEVKAAITKETAAIMLEPILGEGGIIALEPEFLDELRQVCDENDLLLFFDCVQCGMGRTGKLFAYQYSSIEPDICAIAKGAGGGFPFGACLTVEKVGKHMLPGMHGATYGGNFLACAVALAVFNEITKDGFLQSVMESSNYLRGKLEKINGITSISGKGLMIGAKLDCATDRVADIRLALVESGLLCANASGGIIRFLPPLNISKSEIDQGVEIIEQVLSKELVSV